MLSGVILGGTSLLGGSGSIVKTVIGVLIPGFHPERTPADGYPYYAQWLVTWVVIILAVWLDVASKRGRLFTSCPEQGKTDHAEIRLAPSASAPAGAWRSSDLVSSCWRSSLLFS